MIENTFDILKTFRYKASLFGEPAEKLLHPPYMATCVARWRVQTYINTYKHTDNIEARVSDLRTK